MTDTPVYTWTERDPENKDRMHCIWTLAGLGLFKANVPPLSSL